VTLPDATPIDSQDAVKARGEIAADSEMWVERRVKYIKDLRGGVTQNVEAAMSNLMALDNAREDVTADAEWRRRQGAASG